MEIVMTIKAVTLQINALRSGNRSLIIRLIKKLRLMMKLDNVPENEIMRKNLVSK